MSAKFTFIDLFCGCGGFTLGMQRAGFDCLAAIDFNAQAVDALRTNLKEVSHVLKKDLTEFSPEELSTLIGTDRVDVIVGGPPCQGFSTARQRDGSNHGTERLKEDSRRHLFREFLRHVDYFQPRVFVIENVLGLRSAAGGQYFTAVQHESRILGKDKGGPGYRVHSQIEHGVKLGVPQKRRRQLIVGVRADLPGYFPTDLKRPTRAPAGAMLGDAIGDLPVLAAGSGQHSATYDLTRRTVQFLGGTRDVIRRRYLINVAETGRSTAIMNHVARPHSARDLGDFLRLPEGCSSAELMRKGVKFDFPYDKTSFKDRYTRQHRNRPCSTIVAHLSKDGLMFIHPTQNRSLTPREAARVQTFPDWFVFPEPRTHAFRLIGNAVPPLVSEAVGDAVRSFLHPQRPTDEIRASARHSASPDLPANATQAAARLHVLMHCGCRQLRVLDCDTFIKGWHALLWLFPGLHPDNALDHGAEMLDWPDAETVLPGIEPARRQVHMRSGWPVALVLIGEEAWRRRSAADLSDEQFYNKDAQLAGMLAGRRRNPFPTDPAPDPASD